MSDYPLRERLWDAYHAGLSIGVFLIVVAAFFFAILGATALLGWAWRGL
jgi:hypothetical protein